MALLSASSTYNLCTPTPYLAIGIVSAPDYVHRRAVLRGTWMSLLREPEAADVCAAFVVRARSAPRRLHGLLAAEEQRHGDILRVDVPWNETRKRGPVLTLAAWLRYAAERLGSSHFVAKVDDDSYVHAPGLAQFLRSHVASATPHERVYLGTLTWYSWFPNKWDRCGFGWTWRGSDAMGQLCRNATWAAARCVDGCGSAIGPFPFAAGYLIVLSTPLVRAIAATTALKSEVKSLVSSGTLHTHKGYVHTQVRGPSPPPSPLSTPLITALFTHKLHAAHSHRLHTSSHCHASSHIMLCAQPLFPPPFPPLFPPLCPPPFPPLFPPILPPLLPPLCSPRCPPHADL
jgi:hypothetical protein